MERLTLSIIALSWLLVTLPGSEVSGADPVLDPPTLQDQWQNQADQDSKISWGALPAGSPYSADTSSKTEGLDVLFDMTRGFLDIVQPNELPYELVTDYLDDDIDFSISDHTDTLREYGMGFGVCFAIGILFIIIMPIVGCCFCCCRCCGNCGGKKYQKQTDSTNCRRVSYSIVLFFLTVFMGASVVCIYVSNERMNDAIDTMGDTAVGNLDDLSTFMTNTVDEMNHIAKANFNFTAKVISRDLDNIGVLLGVPVREELSAAGGIDAALTAVSDFETLVEQTAVELLAINSSVQSLKDNGAILDQKLVTASTNLKAAASDSGCFPTVACTNMATEADGLDMDADYSNLPDISDQADQIADVQSKDLSQMVEDGKAEFDNIPYTVENDTKDVVQNLKTQLTDFSADIDEQLKDIQDMPDEVNDNLDSKKKDIEDLSETAKDYNQYRWYAGVGLAGIVTLVVALELSGLTFGVCGHSKTADPTQRGCMSTAGGNMLMAATGLIFIFSWLLMLLTSFSFLIGGNLEKVVCEPLTDPDYAIFKEVLDKPDLLGDGYMLGDMLLQNSSIPLTFESVLEGCKRNGAAYTVMKLDSKFNLDEVTDYRESVNIQTEIDSIDVDLDSVEIMDSATKDELRDFSQSVQLDFDGFRAELEKNTTQVDLLDLAGQVRTLASTSSNPSKDKLLASADDLEDIHNTIYQTVNDNQAQLLSDIETFESTTSTIPTNVNNTIDAVEAAENYLKTQAGSAIKNESLIYAERLLGIADSFANSTSLMVKEDVGKCEPVWNIYESVVHTLLCKQMVDSFNGFWFGLGWAIFFMVPSVIFNVKLAKHFRKMKYSDINDRVGKGASAPPYHEMPPPYGQPPLIQKNNKVGHSDLKY